MFKETRRLSTEFPQSSHAAVRFDGPLRIVRSIILSGAFAFEHGQARRFGQNLNPNLKLIVEPAAIWSVQLLIELGFRESAIRCTKLSEA